MDSNKVCFIIAHKYFRGYPSYLKYYISNIQKFYPEALTVVVDNNSLHGDDIFDTIEKNKNIVIISNKSDSKFEIGAYCEGIRYLLNNNIIGVRGSSKYEHFIFTQDNYIIKKKYDFSKHTDKACAIHAAVHVPTQWHFLDRQNFKSQQVREKLVDFLDSTRGDGFKQVWCSSLVLHESKVENFLEILGDCIITKRNHSEQGERFLGMVVCYLNDNIISDIDREPVESQYPNVCLESNDSGNHYFMKLLQGKTENTEDK